MTEMILDPRAVEQLMLDGDLGKLNASQRIQFYSATCHRVGLDPIARPFDYLRLNGKVVLYANKSCAEQLRCLHNISLFDQQTTVQDGIFIATISAKTPDGRTDTDSGAVPIDGLQGERLSNAMLKGITKAKRRVTLSLVGLGMMDETEVETIPGAQRVAPEDMEDSRTHLPQRLKTVTTTDGRKASVPHDVKTQDIGRIMGVEHKTNDRGEWWVITLEGEDCNFTTFSSTIAEQAVTAYESDLLVKYTSRSSVSKRTGEKYTNIDTLTITSPEPGNTEGGDE
jgi:hypothetical protein